MKRQIFKMIPRGLQEKIKLLYYNARIKGYTFSRKNNHYITRKINSWLITSLTPLYFIVKDVNRYEKFYSVSPGDNVIDAGANEGILTLIYSKKVREAGNVYAFEPDRKNIKILEKNLSLNSKTENIYLEEKGLWSKKDIIDFYETGTVGASVFLVEKPSIKKRIEVTSIDDFVRKKDIRKLDFIKMDIEGAEIQALKGSRETLKKLQPNMAIASYHIIDGENTYKKLEVFFNEEKYPFKTVFFEDGEVITYAGPKIKGAD